MSTSTLEPLTESDESDESDEDDADAQLREQAKWDQDNDGDRFE